MTVALSAAFPGVSRVLEEGAKLGLWSYIKLAPGVQIPKDTSYILGYYTPEYEEVIQYMTGAKITVLWTSSPGEVEFEPVEQMALDRLVHDPRIARIWFGDPVLGSLFPKGYYAPYPIQYQPKDPVKKTNTVSLFCPPTLKKNALNQVLAVYLYQMKYGKLRLVTNHPVAEWVAKLGIKLDYELVDWLPKSRYEQVIASARVNLVVSWAETFSYQAADAVMLGTPTVASFTVPWLSGCQVSDPNSPESIAKTLKHAIDNPENWLEGARKGLAKYAEADFRASLAL